MASVSTGKGDDGYTDLFSGNARIPKSSTVCELLGGADELNSFLGLCRAKSAKIEEGYGLYLKSNRLSLVIFDIQNDIFVIQAELAGAQKQINREAIEKIERLVADAEKIIPKNTSFAVPGEGELSAYFDISRSVCRRVERVATQALSNEKINKDTNILRYLNRLSDLLYCINRFVVFKMEAKTDQPYY